ncbi:MAG TPA: hypothetical protein VM639_22690 [Dongiaceae bacterium]|nr:hypothetical protein [Dongiaceae bacterium]
MAYQARRIGHSSRPYSECEFRGIRPQLNTDNILNKDYIAAGSVDSRCSSGMDRNFLRTLRCRW